MAGLECGGTWKRRDTFLHHTSKFSWTVAPKVQWPTPDLYMTWNDPYICPPLDFSGPSDNLWMTSDPSDFWLVHSWKFHRLKSASLYYFAKMCQIIVRNIVFITVVINRFLIYKVPVCLLYRVCDEQLDNLALLLTNKKVWPQNIPVRSQKKPTESFFFFEKKEVLFKFQPFSCQNF